MATVNTEDGGGGLADVVAVVSTKYSTVTVNLMKSML